MTPTNPTAVPMPEISVPTKIPITPLMTHIDFDILQNPSGGVVGMRIQDPGGVKIVMLSADEAKHIGEQMRNAGTRASIGLVIPTAKLP